MSNFLVYPSYLQDRVTQPDLPGSAYSAGRDWWVAEQLGLRSEDQVIVTHHSALTYSVVWRCVSLIAQTIASLGWHVFQRQEDGRTKLPIEDNIAWTLGMQASAEMTSFEWRQVMLRDALLWGNGYAEIERNGAGKPLWFHRIDPARVWVDRDDQGKLYYTVYSPYGGNITYLDPANVYHLKGLGPDGIVGYSVVTMARKAIELGLSGEGYGQQFMRRGPKPGGFLEVPGAMKEEERRSMAKSFNDNFGGAQNAGKMGVLSGGVKFVPFSMSNEDMQFIESRSFQGEEICRWYGVPPHKAGIMDHSTFGNIEHQAIEFVQDCLLPWCVRLESEANVKLFGMVTMGRRFTKLDLASLMRGDSTTLTSNIKARVTSGLETVNEGRAELDMNPIEGGDTPLIQGAMIPLEQAADPPEPVAPAAPAIAPEPDEEDAAEMPEEVAAAFGQLFIEAYGRLLRVESEKATRADKQGRLAAWATEFYGSADAVAAAVKPVVAALLLAAGKKADAAALAARLAADHVERSRRAVGGADLHSLTNGRAAEQAQRHLGMIWEAVR